MTILAKRYMKKQFFLFAFFLLFFASCYAQDSLLLEVNQQRLQINKTAMWVLGSWAVGNMATSGILRSQTSGSTRYFHEMNVFWNVVNLGLAGGSLYATYRADPGGFTLWQSLGEQESIEKLLLFNAGLDVGYIMTGAYLMERSRRATNRPERLKGYGQSLLLQGGFLLAFDLTFYLIQHKVTNPTLQQLIQGLSVTPQGMGLNLTF